MVELYKVLSASERKTNSSLSQGNVGWPQLELVQRMTRLDINDAFPWGAWPRDAAVTRTSKQAGKALRSQGHQYARVM